MTEPTIFDAFSDGPEQAGFDGVAYDAARDKNRLTGQIQRVWQVMSDGNWRTVAQIVRLTGDPANSVQAQLRNLRKKKFGAYLVERRRATETGLYEWRVGEKGEGTPQHAGCKNCEVLSAQLVILQNKLTEFSKGEQQ